MIVPHASAACWVFDRRWFERVGGFDPAYGLGYYEDLDLSAVAESTGAAVVVQPASTVRHDVGGSFTSQTSAVLSHRNHRRALTRWEWLRRDLSAISDPRVAYRSHGAVLLLGFSDVGAAPLLRSLAAANIAAEHLEVLDPAELSGRGHLDDVVVEGPALLQLDASAVVELRGAAPRAVWCTAAGLEQALVEAGVCGGRLARGPRHNLLNSVRSRPW